MYALRCGTNNTTLPLRSEKRSKYLSTLNNPESCGRRVHEAAASRLSQVINTTSAERRGSPPSPRPRDCIDPAADTRSTNLVIMPQRNTQSTLTAYKSCVNCLVSSLQASDKTSAYPAVWTLGTTAPLSRPDSSFTASALLTLAPKPQYASRMTWLGSLVRQKRPR